jgi:NAD(P)H-dependent FMN reductase
MLAKNKDVQADVIDMADWNNLPPMTRVFTSIDNTPAEFKELSRRIFEADGFILVTPEYNGSYSPSMKNMLDHFPKQHHKAFGIVTASPGALGGVRASQQLLVLVPALFGIASPYLLVVPQVDKKFGTNGELLDESFSHAIHNFVSEFLWLLKQLQQDVSIK